MARNLMERKQDGAVTCQTAGADRAVKRIRSSRRIMGSGMLSTNSWIDPLKTRCLARLMALVVKLQK